MKMAYAYEAHCSVRTKKGSYKKGPPPLRALDLAKTKGFISISINFIHFGALRACLRAPEGIPDRLADGLGWDLIWAPNGRKYKVL